MITPSARIGVVISGASSGIGQATAEAFAGTGARLVLAARGQEALQAVAEACRRKGAEVEAVPTDVTDLSQVHSLVERARGFAGTIDMWISNVGVGVVGRYHEVPMEAHEQVLRANLLGHMYEAHAVVPVFLAQGHGTFVNMISMGAFAGAPQAASYSASKFGLRGFSQALRAELSRHRRIHVCDVYPTFVDTPGISEAANFTGFRLSAPKPIEDPRSVAAALVRLATRPRHTVLVGRVAPLMRLAAMLPSGVTGHLMQRLLERHWRHAAPAPVTEGKLFAPTPGSSGIDGGLRRS